MKKSLILLPLAALVLSGCTIGGLPGGGGLPTKPGTSTPTSTPTSSPTNPTGQSDPTSDPEPQIPDDVARQAIEYAEMESLASISRKTDLIEDTPTKIGHNPGQDGGEGIWNNDYLYLTTRQLVEVGDDRYRVSIDWTPKDSPVIREVMVVDDNHVAMYFNYSKTEEINLNIKATLTLGNVSDEVSYSVTLLTKNIEFLEVSLQDIYKVAADGQDFDLVDHSTGYYKKNNENFTFTCVETYGEVLYTAPDGNWALIGAGNRVLELYSGSAKNLNTGTFPALTIGNAVIVRAELGSYYGNCQISFIFDIVQGDASKYDAPTGYGTLTGSMFAGKQYYESELMNGLFSANAVFKGNIVQDKKVVEASALKYGRFTFDAEIDGQKITVAYDYHCDESSSKHPILDAFKAKLQTLNVGDTFSLKGTVRYAGNVEKSYKGQTAGLWSIVPFLADHIA